MAAFVQQLSGGAFTSDQVFSTSKSLPSPVTAGNTVLCPFYHANFDSNGTTVSCSDGTNTFVLDSSVTRGGTYIIGMFRFNYATGGSPTITFTSSSGTSATNSYWRGNVLEYSGLSGTVDTAAIRTAQNGASAGPVAVTSGTLAQNVELVMYVATAESAQSGFGTSSGFTNRGTLTVLNVGEQFTTTNAAVTANCGTLSPTTGGWDILIIPYQIPVFTPPPVTPSKLIFIMP